MLVECIVLRVELFSPPCAISGGFATVFPSYISRIVGHSVCRRRKEKCLLAEPIFWFHRSLCVDADVYGVWRRKRESTGGATGLYGRNRHFDNSFVCESASCQRRVYGREHIEIRWSKSCFQTTTTTIHAASLFPLNGRPSSQMTGIVVMGRHCCCSLMCDIIDDHRQLSILFIARLLICNNILLCAKLRLPPIQCTRFGEKAVEKSSPVLCVRAF